MIVQHLLHLFSFLFYVAAQDNRATDENNHFIYPPLPGPQFSNDPTVFQDNILLTAGVKQNEPFKWVSNLTNFALYLQQEGNGEYVKAHNLIYCDRGGDGWLYWDGDLGSIDLNIGSIAYLAVWNCSEGAVVGTPVFFSHYFNLTAATSSASASTATVTSETASPTTDTSTSATFTSATRTSSSAVDSTSPASTQNPQPSNDTAVLAGGIGGGIGGAIIIVAVAFAFWKLGRRRRAQDTREDQSYLPPTRPTTQNTDQYIPGASVRSFPMSPRGKSEIYPQQALFKAFNSEPLTEMSSQPSPIELPTNSTRSPTQRFQME